VPVEGHDLELRGSHAIIRLMEDLLPRLRKYVARHSLFVPGAKVVLGVSGGPDSLCLLHLLHRLAPELELHLFAAHLNHHLRGADADGDAAFVVRIARDLGVPCTVGHADVSRLAATQHLSMEEAARHARYHFLSEVAASTGASAIAVGHNADDQAETVLMHFLRGSGVDGLRGMLPRATLGDYRLIKDPDLSIQLVRPLLDISRANIAAYCAAHDLHPRFDVSNEDRTIFRNRLRHELLPFMEAYNPAIRRVLATTARVMAGDQETLRAETTRAWARAVRVADPGQVQFDLDGWRSLPVGLQRATLREAIQYLRQSLRDVGWEHVERAVILGRAGRSGQCVTLVAGLVAELGYEVLRVSEEGTPSHTALPHVSGSIRLQAPGVTLLADGWSVMVRDADAGETPEDAGGPDPWHARLDADAVGPDLLLRPRLPGDRFRPQGMGGHRSKLNEFMINAKVPRGARNEWPILVGQNGIAWVCGLRVDEGAIVRRDTRRVWRVTFIRQAGG